MSLTNQSNLIAKVAGIAGTATLAVLFSLPSLAESPMSTEQNNRNTENIGPSAVPGQTISGPSETPSGSPSVPGTSSQDDPNYTTSPDVPTQDTLNNPMDPMRRDSLKRTDESEDLGGPSAVLTESFPGPSETPSGSPSVPGVSNQDDPATCGCHQVPSVVSSNF